MTDTRAIGLRVIDTNTAHIGGHVVINMKESGHMEDKKEEEYTPGYRVRAQ